MSAAETHASILSLPQLVNTDAGLVRRGRYFTATFLVEAGDTEFLVRVVEGRLASVERGPFLMRPWTFALRASAETWPRFFDEIRAAARSLARRAGHAAPPMILMVAASLRTASGRPAKMISPRSIT